MHSLIQQLIARGPILTDGAWGTELQSRGLGMGEFPDLWNLSHPDKVLEVAKAYVDAGSEIILTNTFGANRVRLGSEKSDNQVVAINRAGVEISKEAARDHALVFASIGPTGKLLMDEGIDLNEIRFAFMEQADALASAGADAFVIETMSDLAEAKLALEAARPFGLPVIVSMVFDSGQEKDRTMMGNTPEQVAASLIESGADVIGANCGAGIDNFITLCRAFRRATAAPIWIKPNAGLPAISNGTIHYHVTSEQFACSVPALVAAGANLIGGCCGTNPNFIRAIRAGLDQIQNSVSNPFSSSTPISPS